MTDDVQPIEVYTEPCGCYLKIYEDGSIDETACVKCSTYLRQLSQDRNTEAK